MDGQILNSDPQVMSDIAKEILRYATTLKSEVGRLYSKNRAVGANWSGEQYEKFSEVIANVKKTLDEQADKLASIASDVKKDAVALAEALGVKIKGV